MTDEELQAAIDEAVAMDTAEQKLAALERLRGSVIRERMWQRVMTALSILAAGAAIVLAVVALIALDRFENERADRSRGSCLQYNEQQARSREGNKLQVREVFASLTNDEALTPEDQAQLDQLFDDHDQVIDEAFPDRDCSPEGIDEYLEAHS